MASYIIIHSCTVLMCRDYVSQKEMEMGMYEQANLTIESLLRYDSKTSHMAYYIRGYAI